ncbi:hypothetical protein HYPSUDRAFT_137715 [Hypholoma sublateritium FD-334 SS-4]|uniref:Uncharacterized protein n=1 Tax=Hypholoma sublateritium (strain FD-334 SS-4) TaxID=945553 RepID=A0A0D2P4B9_HYPSF|nr:hypothetical protein HYPSUDRAFT_137715 [Hypholoma sublateritium FD-334 SS-4]
MNIPPAEKRRLKVSVGALPSPKIASLAACHPFTQQLDVVFPANAVLLAQLGVLETHYGTCSVTLSEVVTTAPTFVNAVEGESSLLIVSAAANDEDAWCVDPRGHLTLSVAKEAYERLGLVGQKLPFKGHDGHHTIDIPLRKNALSPAMQARVGAALTGWDQRRARTWDAVFCAKDRGQASPPPFAAQTHAVRAEKRELKDVYVPVLGLCARPTPPAKAQSKKKPGLEGDAESDVQMEAAEDWDCRVESLFEWVGMACLGSQRLNANDRVDPYVALYEHPAPKHMQDVTHLRWRGLLPPSFIKESLDTIAATLDTPTGPPFVGVAAHALSGSPVSYLPYTSVAAAGDIPAALQAPAKVPAKVPRAEGEDTWCAIFERGAVAGAGLQWCLGESLGQLDARWG